MKKILYYIIMASALVAAVSCNKPAPEKSEVESHFKAKGDIPTVEIVGDITVDLTTAKVTFKVSGVTESSLDSLSIGVLTSKNDPYFGSSSFTPIKEKEDGTYTLDVTVSPKSKTYFRAVAANVNGTHYSDDVVMDIPDVPFHLKVAGEWYAKESSMYYSDEYERYITVIVDEQDFTKCIVANIEPYWQSYGYVYDAGYNYVAGTIDDDKKTIVIDNGTSINLGDRVLLGINAPTASAATGYADVVFQMDDNDNLVRANGIIIYRSSKSSAEDGYAGGVTYVKE